MKKRADGLYQQQILLGKDENGKRLTKTFYGKTQKEVKEKIEKYKKSAEMEKYLFRSVADSFLSNNDDTTLEHRIRAFTKKIGSMEIAEINAMDLEKILQEIALKNPSTNKPTSQRTLQRYLQSVNQVFRYAERNRMISFNPCSFVRLPTSVPPKERNALKLEEIRIIEQTTHKATDICVLLAYTGLRRGEATALTVGDINFKKKIVTINKAWSFKKNCLKPPKTKNGNRDVPIPDKIVPLLKKMCKGKKKDDLLILNDFGQRMTEASWQNHLEGIVAASGIEFTWHQLRHSYASICYQAGIDVLSYAKFCGHSKRVSLEIYTHLAEEQQKISANKLNKFIK